MTPLLKFELIKAIIEHGALAEPGRTVDPSMHDLLLDAGNGLVTTYIEQLTLLGLVSNPKPMYGLRGGMWIGYQLTEEGNVLSISEDELRRAVASLIGGPKSEVSESVKALIDECRDTGIRIQYRENFLRTLEEIRICFDEECFIATIGLCGKVLEVTLKEILHRNDIEVPSNTMLGGLIRLVNQNINNEYIDQTLTNVARIINTNRIPAVHAVETIAVPSRDQTIMVIFAMRDVVRRNLTHSGN